MNHLEQLVAEWLQYNKYFVRVSVQVGPRPRGGFEGELDVVGINLAKPHIQFMSNVLWTRFRMHSDSTGSP